MSFLDNYDELVVHENALKNASDIPKIAGEIELTHFRLISPNNYPGASIDLRFMMTKFEVVENLFSPYVSGYIEITDAIGLYEKIPIIGEEYFHLSFKSKGAPQTDKIDRIFRIVRVINFNKNEENDRMFSYRLEFISLEYLYNLKTRVQKSYMNQKIDSMVADIYENFISKPLSDRGIDNDIINSLSMERTRGEYNLVIPNMRPLDAMNFLAHRAMSAENPETKGAFYSFYDTVKGKFYFNSLESLMQNPNKDLIYTYSPANIPFLSEYGKISHESKIIKDYVRISALDVEDNLKNGMYANRLITHNLLRMRYDIHDHYYKKPAPGSNEAYYDKQTGAFVQRDDIHPNPFKNNEDEAILTEIFSTKLNEDFDNSYHISDNPIISLRSDVLGSPESNITLIPSNKGCVAAFSDPDKTGKPSDPMLRESNVEQWFSKRRMQMKLLNSYIYQLILSGNSHRTIGDMIKVEIPSSMQEAITSTSKSHLQSNALVSGKFFVTRVSHVFVNLNNMIDYNLDVRVMRDSLSRQLPVPAVQGNTYAVQDAQGQAVWT